MRGFKGRGAWKALTQEMKGFEGRGGVTKKKRILSCQVPYVKVPLEKVVDDFANMGFTRDQVRSVVHRLTESGQTIDTNVVLDHLMNPRR